LAREFGISFRHHNAEEDAVASARVVLRAAEEYSAESVEELLERTRIRFGEVSTGKYVSCRRISIPKKRGRAKLVYVAEEGAD
jgi:DNA polymerase-3 subunit epsilon